MSKSSYFQDFLLKDQFPVPVIVSKSSSMSCDLNKRVNFHTYIRMTGTPIILSSGSYNVSNMEANREADINGFKKKRNRWKQGFGQGFGTKRQRNNPYHA